jgi:hypothetical protein
MRFQSAHLGDDQIWQFQSAHLGNEIPKFRFSIPDNSILIVSEHEQDMAELKDWKILGVLKQGKGLEGIKGVR